ncbi:multicopper oxidase-domain-containing protein, partial [Colletotrichum cereale]
IRLCSLFLSLLRIAYAASGETTSVSKGVPTQSCLPQYLGARTDGKKENPPWAPDGFKQTLITVNGRFPGPLLEANWGDMVEVTTHNNITDPEEGTAMHWHGIHQQDTGLMDGVSGITQCPSVPGGSFTYRWNASTYGSTWYHGHHALQYGGALCCPLIIYGPSHVHVDFDLGPVTLSDYYHYPYEKLGFDAISTSNDTIV